MDDSKDKKEYMTPSVKKAKQKKKYIVHNVTPQYVTLDENGNGFRVANIWKDLKRGDEIFI